MKKIISVFCAVILIVASFAFPAGAISVSDANETLASANTAFKTIISERLDVNGSGKIEAADARLVLLASAGLLEEGLVNQENADLDGDGRITAIDARLFLRIAASLEPVEKYVTLTDAEKLNYFTAIVNSIKPNRYKFYIYEVTKNPKITHNNPALINDINSQMNSISSIMGVESEDFGKELTTPVKDVVSRGYSEKTASNSSIPVKGSQYASVATLDNVKKIEYKSNDTYTIDTKVSYSTVYYPYSDTVTGLDSITVYLKDDNAVQLKRTGNDFDSLNVATALAVLDDYDINTMLNKNEAEVNSLNDTFANMGNCEFKFTPKTIRYHDSYVKVYFDPATGTPVAMDYSLRYNVVMNIDMFIDISTKDITGVALGSIQLLKVDGDLDLDSEMILHNSYYFYGNNPNHAVLNKG